MASLVTSLVDGWNDLAETKSDPRVKDWFLMSSPIPTFTIVAIYVFFSKYLGPKIMENRKPYNLRKTLLVYNFVQVFISIYLFHAAIAGGWLTTYSLTCQPVDYSNSPQALRMAAGAHAYYLSKLTELADTVFFALRKKNNQITNLHVIHHGIMPISVWFGVKFTPGGHSTFFGLLNTFIHIWMYLYYFLAALGPQIQPYLWWKRYLTRMQIVQFIIVLIHDFQLLFIECDVPIVFVWCTTGHAILFTILFTNFYKQAYNDNKKQKKSEFDVSSLEVDPDREGIKQSDLWAKNYEHLAKKRQANGTKNQQTPVYADQYKMATGYISDEGLRNRVFIDNNRSANE